MVDNQTRKKRGTAEAVYIAASKTGNPLGLIPHNRDDDGDDDDSDDDEHCSNMSARTILLLGCDRRGRTTYGRRADTTTSSCFGCGPCRPRLTSPGWRDRHSR